LVAKYAAGGSTIPSEATKYAISNENNIIKLFIQKNWIFEKNYLRKNIFLEFWIFEFFQNLILILLL